MVRNLIYVLSVFLLTSCLDSNSPLSDPMKAKPDKALTGSWRMDDNGDTTYFHVGLPKGKLAENFLHVVQVDLQKNSGALKKIEYLMFTTSVGKQQYLNLKLLEDGELVKMELSEKPPVLENFVLFRYEQKGDSISLLALDIDYLKSAVSAKKIQGEVNQIGTPKLTEGTEKLAAFFAKEGDKVFPKKKSPLIVKRIR